MSSMPWVKLYTEMLDDPKIWRLPDAIKWRFVSLVLLAGECDQDGALQASDKPMSIDDIAWRLRIPSEQCEAEIESLLMCGVIELDADVYYLPKFSDRQGRPQSEKREQWRQRQARYRESKETQDKTQESVTRDSPVTNASRVDKSREEKEKIRADASADKPRHPNKDKATCPADWMTVLYSLTKIDQSTATVQARKNLSDCGKALIAGGATIDQLATFERNWYALDWRGKQGQAPTVKQVRDEWGKYSKPLNGNGHAPQPSPIAPDREAALARSFR